MKIYAYVIFIFAFYFNMNLLFYLSSASMSVLLHYKNHNLFLHCMIVIGTWINMQKGLSNTANGLV
jgi:hypothetical protein